MQAATPKKPHVLIIEPISSGLELLSAAKRLDCDVSVFSADTGACVIPNYYRQFIDNHIVIDTNNHKAMSVKAIALNSSHRIDAVLPGFENLVPVVNTIAHQLHLKCLSPYQANALRNKGIMRQVLEKSALRAPKFFIISSQADIPTAASTIGFPNILKPIDQSGSVRVSRTDNIEELRQAYNELSHDPWADETGNRIGKIAILEAYITGKEFSVEGYVDPHGSHIVSITEKILSAEPYFVEMGHIVPAALDEQTKAVIQNYTHQLVKAFQITIGVFHIEIRIDEHGPMLLEIAGRLAGDKICDLIKLGYDIDLYEIMLQSYLNQAIPAQPHQAQCQAGICYYAPAVAKPFSEIKGITEISKLPGFVKFEQIIPNNATVPPLTSFIGRAAYAIFTADSYQELQALMEQSKALIQFTQN